MRLGARYLSRRGGHGDFAGISALGIAIYGMFIAIIIPPARTSKPILRVVLLAGALSCLFTFTPGLNLLSSGWVIILCAVAASALAALRYPVAKEAQT